MLIAAAAAAGEERLAVRATLLGVVKASCNAFLFLCEDSGVLGGAVACVVVERGVDMASRVGSMLSWWFGDAGENFSRLVVE